MNNNDTEVNLSVEKVGQQQNVPSMGESMGRLLMEANQRMSIEL